MTKVETVVKMMTQPENMCHPPTIWKQPEDQTVPQYLTLFFALSKKQKMGA
jgi:hypothetical protein